MTVEPFRETRDAIGFVALHRCPAHDAHGLIVSMMGATDHAARGNVVNADQVGHPCVNSNPHWMETDRRHGLG